MKSSQIFLMGNVLDLLYKRKNISDNYLLSLIVLFHQPFKSFHPLGGRKKSVMFLFLGALPKMPLSAARPSAIRCAPLKVAGPEDRPWEPGFSFAISPCRFGNCGNFLDLSFLIQKLRPYYRSAYL